MTDLLPGDVALVHGSGFAARLVRFGQSRRYPDSWAAHAALVVNATGGVIEAQGHGVGPGTLAAEGGGVRVYRPAYEAHGAARAVRAMRDLVGESYGYASDISEALVFLTGTRIRFELGGTLMCSGAVAYALTRADLNLGPEEEFLPPAGLEAIALAQGWQRLR